jgi:hypothetical protein
MYAHKKIKPRCKGQEFPAKTARTRHEFKANHILLHFNINVLQPLPITLCNNLYKLLSLTFVIIPNNHLGPHGIFSTLKDNIILRTCFLMFQFVRGY